jgi:hypothetical protein
MSEALAADPLEGIPIELRRWIERQRPLPDALLACITLHQAVRQSRDIRWQRKVHRMTALTTWVTIILIVNGRTRPYMAKLIRDDVSGLRWTMHCTSAVYGVLAAIDPDRRQKGKRGFLAHRAGVLRGLRAAREHLDALSCNPRLSQLLSREDDLAFRRAVETVERATIAHFGPAVNRILTSGSRKEGSDAERLAAAKADIAVEAVLNTKPVPDLRSLLDAAISHATKLTVPKPSRHGARALYLRSLFDDLANSEIASRRVAFLAYASEAVFGEHIERRAIRRLVADIVTRQKDVADVAELFAQASAGALKEGDISLRRLRRARPLT